MTQIDFLDQLGCELDGAAGRLIREQRRTRYRGILAPAAAMAAVAAIAVAVWPSAPADPEREVAPAAPQSAADILSVLRRPESEADRGPAARQGREMLSRLVTGDVQFRLLATTAGGEGIVLAAGEAVHRPAGGSGDGICVHYPQGEGGGGGCWSVQDVAQARAYGGVAGHMHGLAPDGVARVQVDTLEDSTVVPARENLFDVELRDIREVVAVTFMDEEGRVVARNLHGAALVPVVPVPEETREQAVALAAAPDARVPVPVPPGFGEQADELTAQCLWLRYWLAAVQAGNAEVAAQAARVIETVPRWPSLRTDEEKHAVAAFEVGNGLAPAVARRLARTCTERAATPGP